MTSSIIKKFRKEVKELNIKSGDLVKLKSSEERKNNILAAEVLLKDVFHDRIQVEISDSGFVCGSREELSALKLQEYTKDEEIASNIILSTLNASEIETYLKEKNGIDVKMFIPDSAEVRLLEQLSEDYPDVRHGL